MGSVRGTRPLKRSGVAGTRRQQQGDEADRGGGAQVVADIGQPVAAPARINSGPTPPTGNREAEEPHSGNHSIREPLRLAFPELPARARHSKH